MRTLYLAWQAPDPVRAWFPIGQLDAAPEKSDYVFRYTHGALEAKKQVGFEPLVAFPDFKKRYESSELFPLFSNRVLSPARKDFADYLRWLGLDAQHSDPIAVLSASGGERQTDSLEVFPKIEKAEDNSFRCRFFVHGLRHVSPSARARAENLKAGELLQVALELNNPAAGAAVQLQSRDDYQMIGWAPRYLVGDLLKAMAEHSDLSAKVIQANIDGAPLNQRVLVELTGKLPMDFKPMASREFQPLV